MQIHELTALARNNKASDIHISEGLPLMFRIDGHLAEAPVQLSAAETRSLILSLMDEAHREAITSERIDADFALVAPDGTRSRVNVFYQQGRAAATLRLLNDSIPTLEELAMPPVLTKLADEPRGLILVTGPTGSGKSTTLAAMIDHINKTRSDHIITIEDPIEYVYQGRCSLIHQREVGADVRSFASALRSALREDPDVILVGEMRDYETISAAVTAAETGHLVMSTLHTIGAAQTIDRIIDVCPAGAQNQIRGQLAAVLRAPKKQLALTCAAALLLALHYTAWMTSMSFASTFVSTALVCTQPLFVAALSGILLHEPIKREAIPGAIVAIIGAAAIGLLSMNGEHGSLVGDVLALVGAMFIAGHWLCGRAARRDLPALGYMTLVYMVTALCLLLIAPFTGGFKVTLPSLGGILVLAVVCTLGGHALMTYLLGFVSADVVSFALLGEPIGAAIWALILWTLLIW